MDDNTFPAPRPRRVAQRVQETTTSVVRLGPAILDSWQAAVANLARGSRGRRPRGSASTIVKRAVDDYEEAIAALWESYTTERSALRKKLLHLPEAVIAYLLGFHLPNCARATAVWTRAVQRSGLDRLFLAQSVWDRCEIVDLGAGTGALTQVILAENAKTITPEKTTILLYDTSKWLLAAASDILGGMGFAASIRPRRVHVEEINDPPARPRTLRVVALGYLWNELQPNPRAVTRLRKYFLDPAMTDGLTVIMLLDPANQHPSRNAMTLRDELVSEGGYVPLYPCPAGGTACPMLTRARDWCYSEIKWSQDAHSLNVDQVVGLKRHMLATSGYIFVSARAAAVIGDTLAAVVPVVVGRPVVGDAIAHLICNGVSLVKHQTARAEIILRGEAWRE